MKAMKFIAACALMAWAAAASGAEIARSAAEVRAFRAENPCPVTGRTRGACPGMDVDHVKPLCAGGEDHRLNMQWIRRGDHSFKTFVDVRECRKLARMANRPAQ